METYRLVIRQVQMKQMSCSVNMEVNWSLGEGPRCGFLKIFLGLVGMEVLVILCRAGLISESAVKGE